MRLTEILIILAILFLLALVLAPIYYYVTRDKYGGSGDEGGEK